MEHLPIFLGVKGRRILVDGGGGVAARRVERALSAGAHVLALDPEPGPDLLAVVAGSDGRARVERRLPERTDVEGCVVVYGASEAEDRDAVLHGWTREFGILCNIADAPELCDFITPSIVDRSPVVVAISTAGAAPLIARNLRARLEIMLSPGYGKLAAFVGGFRDRIAAAIPNGRERRHFWERMIEGPVGDLYLAGDESGANEQFDLDLHQVASDGEGRIGEVYVVGAGPGDPDLLSFRAFRLMQRADVVLYDRAINDGILSLVRRDAERIDIGQGPGGHVLSEPEVVEQMLRLARAGNRVLRLVGGDPFLFGRGGEEIEPLALAGVPVKIVPGITAATGCGAYAGIPLSHRDHADSCVFVAMHRGKDAPRIDWDALVRPRQTVAVYMGLGAIEDLVSGLERHGMSPQTDVAVIENGTLPNQRVVTGHLATIAGQVAEASLSAPSMILIGSVVGLRGRIETNTERSGSHRMTVAPGNV